MASCCEALCQRVAYWEQRGSLSDVTETPRRMRIDYRQLPVFTALEIDSKPGSHSVERLAINAENLCGAFAIATGRFEHMQEITPL